MLLFMVVLKKAVEGGLYPESSDNEKKLALECLREKGSVSLFENGNALGDICKDIIY